LTEDISHSGIFVRTDTPNNLRQLVQIELVLPTTGQHLRILAMVAHRLSVPEARMLARIPGMGLNLYGLGPAQVETWTHFVDAAMDEYDESHEVTVEALAARVLEPIRRAHPRAQTLLRAQMQSVDQMYDMLTRDISEGGTFLHTDALQPVGARVQVVIVHPVDASEFNASGRVIRVVESPAPEKGVAVAFDPMDAAAKAQFRKFIESGIPMLDEVLDEEILIESDDPLLL